MKRRYVVVFQFFSNFTALGYARQLKLQKLLMLGERLECAIQLGAIH